MEVWKPCNICTESELHRHTYDRPDSPWVSTRNCYAKCHILRTLQFQKKNSSKAFSLPA